MKNKELETDRKLKIEAMMHLEYIEHNTSRQEIMDRTAAAQYLIQAMLDGSRPDNFDEIVENGRRWADFEKDK